MDVVVHVDFGRSYSTRLCEVQLKAVFMFELSADLNHHLAGRFPGGRGAKVPALFDAEGLG